MAEFRFLCDCTRLNKATGEIKTEKNAIPITKHGHRHGAFRTHNQRTAEKMFLHVKEECAEYDANSRSEDSYYQFTQDNIHVQTREDENSPWVDMDESELRLDEVPMYRIVCDRHTVDKETGKTHTELNVPCMMEYGKTEELQALDYGKAEKNLAKAKERCASFGASTFSDDYPCIIGQTNIRIQYKEGKQQWADLH